MRIIKLCLLLLIFCANLSFSQVVAHSTSVPDSLTVTVREFDTEKISEFKADNDFVYTQAAMNISLWDRFVMWISNLISDFLEATMTTSWSRVLVYSLAIIGLVYVVLRLLNVDALNMLYRGSDKGMMKAAILEEDIHSMDFDKLIGEAMAKHDYRLAIRLMFLHALKLLSDQHLVEWIPGKTNHDYIQELQNAELKKGFRDLNRFFEYAWYGHFDIEKETAGRVGRLFSDWKNKLNG